MSFASLTTYSAEIRIRGETYWLGSFGSALEAGLAYEKAAREARPRKKPRQWRELKERKPELAGQRFGRLVVLERAGGTNASWVCRCDCGAIRRFNSWELKKGRRSCGRECMKAARGRSKEPLYLSWLWMKISVL